jgi:hypothetical protein
MSAEIRPSGCLQPTWISDGVLRHSDRSINIAAYAAIARRQRMAVMQFSIRVVVQFARGAWSAISARGILSKRPVSGKDCVKTGPSRGYKKGKNAAEHRY